MCNYKPNKQPCNCTFLQLIRPCSDARLYPSNNPSNPNSIIRVCEKVYIEKGVGQRVCSRCDGLISGGAINGYNGLATTSPLIFEPLDVSSSLLPPTTGNIHGPNNGSAGFSSPMNPMDSLLGVDLQMNPAPSSFDPLGMSLTSSHIPLQGTNSTGNATADGAATPTGPTSMAPANHMIDMIFNDGNEIPSSLDVNMPDSSYQNLPDQNLADLYALPSVGDGMGAWLPPSFSGPGERGEGQGQGDLDASFQHGDFGGGDAHRDSHGKPLTGTNANASGGDGQVRDDNVSLNFSWDSESLFSSNDSLMGQLLEMGVFDGEEGPIQ